MVPPLTLCAYMKKGPNLRWSLIQCSGGDEGDRTPDLLTASQALSQLSYAPVTRRYYRGRLSLMQGLFWLNLLLTGFPGTVDRNNHSSSAYFYPPSR